MIKNQRYYKNRNLIHSSYTDERLRLLCQIRHEFTNYNKLTYYYELNEDKRRELNQEISKLISNGADYIPIFRENVKQIEDYVDLNNKDTRKRFIEKEIDRLKQINPYLKNAKKLAEINIANMIRLNNSYNRRNNIRKKRENYE